MRLLVHHYENGVVSSELVRVLLMEADFRFPHRVVKLPNGELLMVKECDLQP